MPSRTFLNGIIGRPMVLSAFSGGSISLISFHKSSGIFLIVIGRCFSLLLGTAIEGIPQAKCLSIFGIGSKSLPQHIHLYIPLSLELTYSPEKGSSVPFLLQISYCSGVNCFFHSSSAFWTTCCTILVLSPHTTNTTA